MEFLNKNNTVERIFYIFLIIFILVLSTITVLKELGYMRGPVDDCIDKCNDNNMTTKYQDGQCLCCKHIIQSSRKETLIADHCYEVITVNVTEK